MNSDGESAGESGGGRPAGLFDSLRQVGPTVVAMLRTRLELFGVEFAEERAHAAQMAMLGAFVLLFGGLTLLMLNVLVLTYFWESHRYPAIFALVLLYGAATLTCGIMIQSRLASRPPMFDATVSELKADYEALVRERQD